MLKSEAHAKRHRLQEAVASISLQNLRKHWDCRTLEIPAANDNQQTSATNCQQLLICTMKLVPLRSARVSQSMGYPDPPFSKVGIAVTELSRQMPWKCISRQSAEPHALVSSCCFGRLRLSCFYPVTPFLTLGEQHRPLTLQLCKVWGYNSHTLYQVILAKVYLCLGWKHVHNPYA